MTYNFCRTPLSFRENSTYKLTNKLWEIYDTVPRPNESDHEPSQAMLPAICQIHRPAAICPVNCLPSDLPRYLPSDLPLVFSLIQPNLMPQLRLLLRRLFLLWSGGVVVILVFGAAID
jgi:hypothetical protein